MLRLPRKSCPRPSRPPCDRKAGPREKTVGAVAMNTGNLYPPLDTLKAIDDDLWIVDGPAIAFGPPGMKMRFPTRMTIVRRSDGSLFLHSPTRLVESLRREIEALGRISDIIGPNRIHYWWIPDWHRAFPQARVWLAPHIRRQAGERIDFACNDLESDRGYPWDGEIATLPVPGSYMTEFVFFHSVSRTLILTDLVENFEPQKLGFAMRFLARIGGVLAPDGQMPRDMRVSYRTNKAELKAAVERMIAWDPQRVILAHGAWFAADGARELRRAFRWLF